MTQQLFFPIACSGQPGVPSLGINIVNVHLPPFVKGGQGDFAATTGLKIPPNDHVVGTSPRTMKVQYFHGNPPNDIFIDYGSKLISYQSLSRSRRNSMKRWVFAGNRRVSVIA